MSKLILLASYKTPYRVRFIKAYVIFYFNDELSSIMQFPLKSLLLAFLPLITIVRYDAKYTSFTNSGPTQEKGIEIHSKVMF